MNGLNSKYFNTRLLIVGSGEALDDLKNLAQKLKIENQVVFAGSVPHHEVFNYIDLMDITVMAKSNWYGSPVKIFEYGAMGKAIIAPDVIPVRDVMIDAIDGILVQPEQVALTNALEKLFIDEKLRKNIADNFKQKVLANHTWEKMAEKLLSSLSENFTVSA